MTVPAAATLQAVRSELGQSGAFYMDRVDARTMAQVSQTLGTAYSLSSFAGRTCINYQVNIGTDGGNNFGYSGSGSLFGARAPTTLIGNNVEKLTFNNHASVNGPIIWISGGGLPPNLFYAAMYRNFVGLDGTQPSGIAMVSAATFNTDLGTARAWQWNSRPDCASNWPGLVGQTPIVQIVY